MNFSKLLVGFKSSLCAIALLGAVMMIQPVSTAYADSLREVAERVARQHDAKVVSAREVTDRNGQTIYVIRILTREGVVRTIRVPARNRQIQIELRSADKDSILLIQIDQQVALRKRSALHEGVWV